VHRRHPSMRRASQTPAASQTMTRSVRPGPPMKSGPRITLGVGWSHESVWGSGCWRNWGSFHPQMRAQTVAHSHHRGLRFAGSGSSGRGEREVEHRRCEDRHREAMGTVAGRNVVITNRGARRRGRLRAVAGQCVRPGRGPPPRRARRRCPGRRNRPLGAPRRWTMPARKMIQKGLLNHHRRSLRVWLQHVSIVPLLRTARSRRG
jgi:hypothetical protein